MNSDVLNRIKIVTLALNIPGPVAVSRLTAMGATCTKIEPPAGDPLRQVAAALYASLSKGQNILTLDLKTEDGRRKMDELLGDVDLLITSFRPSALERMGLHWPRLHRDFPRLCVVNIIGYPHPHAEIPGHDLTYQGKLGFLQPPQLPVTLHADMAGADRTVSASLALLLDKARIGHVGCAQVSLFDAISDFALPLTAGLTAAGGALGGGFAFYGLYQTSDGWIAVAALETVFISRLTKELDLISAFGQKDARKELERIFLTRSADEWEKWAGKRDLPIIKVRI